MWKLINRKCQKTKFWYQSFPWFSYWFHSQTTDWFFSERFFFLIHHYVRQSKKQPSAIGSSQHCNFCLCEKQFLSRTSRSQPKQFLLFQNCSQQGFYHIIYHSKLTKFVKIHESLVFLPKLPCQEGFLEKDRDSQIITILLLRNHNRKDLW